MRDVESALLRPSGVRQDRSLNRALDYIREHFGEALPLVAVARVAGFAPSYFSSLFAERQGITFQEHVRNLRMDREGHARFDSAERGAGWAAVWLPVAEPILRGLQADDGGDSGGVSESL